ncbi:MAG: FKBP-type peptidyl-prolyl cis-trans isomerase [Ferruginibacter sp.]
MRNLFYLLLLTAIVSSSCKSQSYTKGGEGMEYKIISEGKGETLKPGQFVEFEFVSILRNGTKDSVLSNTRETGAPQIIAYDSAGLPGPYFKIFGQLKKGDSLSTRIMTDSVFKKQPEAMPPYMKKGQYLYTNLRVLNIYKTQEDADKARQAGMAAQEAAGKAKAAQLLIKDDKTLQDYFAKNNIKALKTPKGAYVEILQGGNGPMLDTTVFAKINYTGRTLNGKMFDSNTDPAKLHVEPLSVNLTNDMNLGGAVIPGMSDGLRMLSKAAKARIYIPSGLGYGTSGSGADIAPNSNLVFEVDVLEVMGTAQAAAERVAAQKKMEAAQKRYVDSMQKAQPTPMGN